MSAITPALILADKHQVMAGSDKHGNNARQRPDGTSRDSLLRRFLTPAPQFELVTPEHPERGEVESCIRERYHSAYGARVAHFMPSLLTMRCLGSLTAVAGMQAAGTEKLYLEQYLCSPLEQQLSTIAGTRVCRDSVVEIGNLVATQRGASHLLFLLFTSMLHRSGYEWLAFTATRSLRNNLAKLGFALYLLQPADPGKLDAAARESWGNYYQTEPVVVAGRLADAMAIIQSRPVLRHVLRMYRYQINYLAEEFGSL